jgi:O-antigen/teichoic acid export membrane protein
MMLGIQADNTCDSSTYKRDLDHSLLRGIAWTGAVKWGSQLVSWLSTIVVARVLVPSDYGLVAMAMAFLGLVALVREFGLGSAIVMIRNLDSSQLCQLNGLAFLLGIAAFLISCASAVPLSNFYNAPDLPWVVVALGGAFLTAGASSVPNSILEKELQFKTLALIEGLQSFLNAAVTILAAVLGFGYWALVLGGLVSGFVAGIIVIKIAGVPIAVPRCSTLNNVLSMSWHLLASRLAWYASSTADIFIAGRFLGQASLGSYSFAFTLANIPMEKVTALVNRVTPAFYSKVQDNFPALRRYVLGLTEVLAIVTFPVAFGLAIVSQEFVLFVLGEKWQSTVAPLGVLAIYAAVRSVSSLMAPILFVTGGSRFGMFNGFWTAIILPLGFFVGSTFGITGIALAWMLVNPLTLAPVYWKVFSTIQLRPSQYLLALWPALSSTAVMVAAVLVAKQLFPHDTTLTLRFLTLVVTGVSAYFAMLWVVHRARLEGLLAIVRATRPS